VHDVVTRPSPVTTGRAAVATVVVVLHALLLLWWRPAASPSVSAPQERLVVRLVPRPEAVDRPTTRAVGLESQATSPRDRRPARARSGGAEPSTLVPADSQTAIAAPVDGPPSSPARRPLDLTVRADTRPPPPAAAVLTDPRANRHWASLGEVLAQRLGADDRRYEDIRPDGSVRIRQGTSCYEARLSRSAELDPFRSADHPSPRQMSSCD